MSEVTLEGLELQDMEAVDAGIVLTTAKTITAEIGSLLVKYGLRWSWLGVIVCDVSER